MSDTVDVGTAAAALAVLEEELLAVEAENEKPRRPTAAANERRLQARHWARALWRSMQSGKPLSENVQMLFVKDLTRWDIEDGLYADSDGGADVTVDDWTDTHKPIAPTEPA